MSSDIIITFLVPCFNVAHCVQRCLDSFLNSQAFKQPFELLLVNDGSTDSTLSLLQQYENLYPHTVRVIDKPNGGWGSVVNLGIRQARGKYLKVVDADDQIDSSVLLDYLMALNDSNADCVITGYTEIHNSDNHEIKRLETDNFSIHALTFRTALLRDANITIGERYYCDIELATYPLPLIHSWLPLHLYLYRYYRNIDGQSTSAKGYARHYQDMNSLSFRMVSFYHSLPGDTSPECRNTVFNRTATTVEMSYKLMLSPEFAGLNTGIKNELQAFDSQLRSLSPLFYRTMNHRLKHHIPYILIWRLTRINLMLI